MLLGLPSSVACRSSWGHEFGSVLCIRALENAAISSTTDMNRKGTGIPTPTARDDTACLYLPLLWRTSSLNLQHQFPGKVDFATLLPNTS